MDGFLAKITQHAMNYAIRSGIGITASYAISQTSRLLKTVDNNADYQELRSLQDRLDSKIRIISPAIDMVELISARGNTTLESAVTLTKALRWDIQSLGVRLAQAASTEEASRRSKSKTKSKAAHELEIRNIVQDIKTLLNRIEDAVPLINLAITTSGASLSTTLPASVSPSRLLQASTFLTTGDTQYSLNPNVPAQVGPAFTLSLYMLFTGHIHRAMTDADSMRDTTWKEVIHKARVKLIRTPLKSAYSNTINPSNNATQEEQSTTPVVQSIEDNPKETSLPGEGSMREFAYQLEIIEDLDDGRLHTFEDDEPQPGPCGDVQVAGIREFLPIHQVSKIFYADTGKILNIGNQGETNSPVLLLKRDIKALPPRRMMEYKEKNDEWYGDIEEEEASDELGDESQDDIDQQIRQESSIHVTDESIGDPSPDTARSWRFPPHLDPEWLALEVYAEAEESNSEDGQEPNDDSNFTSYGPGSSEEAPTQASLAAGLSDLSIDLKLSSPSSASISRVPNKTPSHLTFSPRASPFGPIRSSLSLLEMLIRLTALQQFQQASHLSIPDELLTFFLEESSTTGASGDGDERRRIRREARSRVGFDPYDESPVKRRGEDYQYQSQGREDYRGHSTGGTPYDDYDQRDGYVPSSPEWQRESTTTPEPWLLRTKEGYSPQRSSPDVHPSSPVPQYRGRVRRATRPLDRVKHEGSSAKAGSPLGRGISVQTDSTLGTSPGSPTACD